MRSGARTRDWARKSKSLGDATSHVTAKVYLQPQGGFEALKRDVSSVHAGCASFTSS